MKNLIYQFSNNRLAKLFSIIRLANFILYKLLTMFVFRIYQFIFLKSNSTLLIIQFPNTGGTKKYFEYLLDFYLKNRNELIILIKDNEHDQLDTSLHENKYIKFVLYSSELDLFEYHGTIKSVNYFYNLYKNICQAYFIYKICFKYRSKGIVISACVPGTLFSAFFVPIPVTYVMHSMPWSPLDRIGQSILEFGLKFPRNNLITVSEFSKRVISDMWKLDPPKIIVVYNYFERTSKSFKIFDLPEKYVLTIGTVTHGKNPFFWIDIAKEVIKLYPNIYFIWAGDGNLLEKAKQSAKGNNNILFYGHVTNVDELYSSALFYFSPSLRESHGISVVGAMSYGLACIVGNIGGTIESVTHNYNGLLCDPNDFDSFLQGILFLIQDPNIRYEYGRNGIFRFNEMFTKQKWESKMIEYL